MFRVLPFFLVVAGCDAIPGAAGPADVDCSPFTEELRNRFGFEAQLVLNLSQGDADTYDSLVDGFGLPDPETFREMHDAFAPLDLWWVDPIPGFQRPPEIASGLETTADVLEDALAAGTTRPDPRWTALSDFYTPDFFVNHNASLNYYLDEAGCSP